MSKTEDALCSLSCSTTRFWFGPGVTGIVQFKAYLELGHRFSPLRIVEVQGQEELLFVMKANA